MLHHRDNELQKNKEALINLQSVLEQFQAGIE